MSGIGQKQTWIRVVVLARSYFARRVWRYEYIGGHAT